MCKCFHVFALISPNILNLSPKYLFLPDIGFIANIAFYSYNICTCKYMYFKADKNSNLFHALDQMMRTEMYTHNSLKVLRPK